MDLNKAWKYSQGIQESRVLHSFLKPTNKLDIPYNSIAQRTELFRSIQEQAIGLVNNFLEYINVDITNPIFRGGVDPNNAEYQPRDAGFVKKGTLRILPDKYIVRSKGYTDATTKKNYGDTENGLAYLDFNVRTDLRESNGKMSLGVAVHEAYHQIFFGEEIARPNITSESSNPELEAQVSLILKEGVVELLKNVTMQYYDRADYNVYPNETAFMFHLVYEVAEKLGKPGYRDYKNAFKIMVEWASTGGKNKLFVQLCKKIKTQAFPAGFDIYSTDESQMRRLNNFLYLNHGRNPDLNKVISTLKNKI